MSKLKMALINSGMERKEATRMDEIAAAESEMSTDIECGLAIEKEKGNALITIHNLFLREFGVSLDRYFDFGIQINGSIVHSGCLNGSLSTRKISHRIMRLAKKDLGKYIEGNENPYEISRGSNSSAQYPVNWLLKAIKKVIKEEL